MEWFEQMAHLDSGELHVRRDATSGLCAIIAIHDVTLGPALGGCRFLEYASERDALHDVLRLSRGMTYKAALAGVPFGGGKSVILRPKQSFDRARLFRAFGRFVEDLGGRYITAEDSGTCIDDMSVVRSQTRHVTGVAQSSGGAGDPSPTTALGVRRGIEAGVQFAMGTSSLADVHVAVQGLGNVGYALCKQLHGLGARLTVADIDPLKVERAVRDFRAQPASIANIARTDCDVFSPCALGGGLNDESVHELRCRVVAGAANNQLAAPRHAEELRLRGIVYVPDYVLNAGGLIQVADEMSGYNAARVLSRTSRIFDTVREILERADHADCSTARIADAMVEETLSRAKQRALVESHPLSAACAS